MPAAIAIPAIVGALGAGATVYGARTAGASARRASGVQARADDASLQYERERDAEAKRQFDIQQQFEAQKWQAQEEQRLRDRQIADYNQSQAEAAEARRAPYRAASQAALERLGDMLGLKFDSSAPNPRVAPAGVGPPMPPASSESPWSMDGRTPTNLPPGSRTFSASPMLNGPSPAPFDATAPGYQPVNPTTAGQVLNLRPRRMAAPRGY